MEINSVFQNIKLDYIGVLFEVIKGSDKYLSYGQFEPFSYHSYCFYKKNLGYDDMNLITKEYIELLGTKSTIEFDSINLIQILNKPIDKQYLSYFKIILDQKHDPNLKIELADNKYILFNDLDYDEDETENICSLTIYKNDDDFVFVTECICDLWDLPDDFELAKERLVKGLEKAKNEFENFNRQDFEDWDEDDIINYKNSLESCIPWLNNKITEITNLPKNYDNNFINCKLEHIKNKIRFYNYLITNRLVNKKKCLIKIANQILRKEKLENSNDIKYNFVVTDFEYNKDNCNMKHYIIQFNNLNEQIKGTFYFDKTGYYSCSGYISKMDIKFETQNKQELNINKENMITIFQGDLFYELFGHSSGDDRDDNCIYCKKY